MKKIFLYGFILILFSLVFIIGLFSLHYNVRFYTTKDRQIYHECLTKGDTNGTLIDPTKINLVKETDYGLFIEIWKVVKIGQEYELVMYIDFVNYTGCNEIRDVKIGENND